MKPKQLFETLFMHTVDGLFAVLPQGRPTASALRRCRLISHRGEHDNEMVFENTIAAFDKACSQGVWGMECDVRWTKDLVPVIFHDPDLQRLFGSSLRVGQTPFEVLRKAFPQIPRLTEVLSRYGKKMHLMVEIKSETYPDPNYQRTSLSEAFSGLSPGADYHFLGLNPQMFQYVDFVPPSTCIPVAQMNVDEMSRLSRQEQYGGIACHYVLMSNTRMQNHQRRGQCVGTAYIRSRNSLYREIHRGVDWLFSNHACKIQGILNHALSGRVI